MNTNPKLKKLKQKKDQIEARIKNMEAREKSKAKKLDTRRKILIGAMVMERMEKNEETKKKTIAMLDGFLTRPLDRNLFGLDVSQSSLKRGDDSQSSRNREPTKKLIEVKDNVTPKTPEKRKTA